MALVLLEMPEIWRRATMQVGYRQCPRYIRQYNQVIETQRETMSVKKDHLRMELHYYIESKK